MARTVTTTDAFTAVAEPRRRQVLDILATGEHAVNDLVMQMGLTQPMVSKHLKVLRDVGLVDVRSVGRQRVYRLNAEPLRPIHEWVTGYEQMWSDRFDAVDVVLDDLKAQQTRDTEDEHGDDE